MAKFGRSNTGLIVTSSIIISLTLGAGGMLFLADKKAKEVDLMHIAKVNELELRLSANTYLSVIANSNIKKGQIIDESMVYIDTVAYGGLSTALVNSVDVAIGSIARVDITTGELITSNMLNEFDPSGIKEKEVSFIRLNSNLTESDKVDVRISYNNGEDYIVLAKQSLKELNLIENNVFLWLTEFELLNLSSATIDASLHEGAFIYVTRYIDTELQDPSEANYVPNKDVIDLIKSNPNIVQKAERALEKTERSLLEARLKLFVDEEGKVTSIDVKNNNMTVIPEEPSEETIYEEVPHSQDYIPEGNTDVEVEIVGG